MITDHLGNKFETIKEMSEYWGVNYSTLRANLKKMSVKEALTKKPTYVYDHLGNKFKTEKDMYLHYGLDPRVAIARKSKGWSIEKILNTPIHDYTVTDHHGNTFPTLNDMLTYYEISITCYKQRLNKGWDLEKTLTTPSKHKNKIPPIDHKGQQFESQKSMCAHYGIAVHVFRYRIKNGWDLETALTLPVHNNIDDKKIIDHLGNEFSSTAELCKHYNISKKLYQSRKKAGWNIEKILTTPHKNTKTTTDHFGNTYKNQHQMCKEYQIAQATVTHRLAKGWCLKDALETPVETITDHLGQTFKSINQMCAHHNISANLYLNRKKSGWSTEEALTTPPQNNIIKDHLNNTYHNIDEMCKNYNINASTFKNRLKKGLSVKDALLMPVQSITEIIDPFGKTFSSIQELSEYYNIPEKIIRARRVQNWSLVEQLEIIPRINGNIPYNTRINHQLIILRNIKDKDRKATIYYEVLEENEETIMTYNEIIKNVLKNIKKEEQDATVKTKENQDHASC